VKYLKLSLIIFIVLAFLFPTLFPVSALTLYPDVNSGWKTYSEEKQYALIEYKNGRQDMTISVNYADLKDGAAWIFPVPSSPNLIVIENLSTMPQKRAGTPIIQKARSLINESIVNSTYTQLYPFFLSLFSYRSSYYNNRMEDKSGLSITSAILPSLQPLGKSAPSTVVVSESLNNNGITTELISTKNGDDLNEYLLSKGINLGTNKLTQLDEYIGKDYSFVVSWMPAEKKTGSTITDPIKKPSATDASNWVKSLGSYNISWPTVLYNMSSLSAKGIYDAIADKYPEVRRSGISQIYFDESKKIEVIDYLENIYYENTGEHTYYYGMDSSSFYGSTTRDNSYNPKSNLKAIKISFPTDNLFFPLIPTSIYGSKKIPIEIQVNDLATPTVYKNIEGMIETTYMSSYTYSSPYILYDRAISPNSSTTGSSYTQININVPSKLLTQDLWISRSATLDNQLLNGFVSTTSLTEFLFKLFITFLLSYIVSILTSLLVFKEARNRKNLFKYGLIGIFNVLSVVVLIFALIFVRTKNFKDEDIELVNAMKAKGYSPIVYRILDYRKLLYIPVFMILFGFITYILSLVFA